MNLYLYTEENFKLSSVQMILKVYAKTYKTRFSKSSDIKAIPVIENGRFTHKYEIVGCFVGGIKKIYCVIFSGISSTIDFLLYRTNVLPEYKTSKPIMAFEETKTNDSESGNAVFQRIIKFVYIKNFYSECKLYMLYNDEYSVNERDKKPSPTNVFGTRLMLTMGVSIIGRDLDESVYTPFTSLDELIAEKNKMRLSPSGRSLRFFMEDGVIKISTCLAKPFDAGNINHDPNIGFLAGSIYVMRVCFGYEGKITVINHGVSQRYMDAARNNKLLSLMGILDFDFDGLTCRKFSLPKFYWTNKKSSEKYGSIFMDKFMSNAGCKTIYENHAGCERSYFKTPTGDITLPKQINGDTFFIPDFISVSDNTNTIFLVEAKKTKYVDNGIAELENYDVIERYINTYYPGYGVRRCVCLFGGDSLSFKDTSVGFVMTSNGEYKFNDNIAF